MKDLIERLEKATGPDRELDALIGTELGLCDHSGPAHHRPFKDWAKPYTSSIDAALTLVPDNHTIYLSRPNLEGTSPVGSISFACVAPPGLGGPQYAKRRGHLSAHHKSFPIALCIAALRARLHSPAGIDGAPEKTADV